VPTTSFEQDNSRSTGAKIRKSFQEWQDCNTSLPSGKNNAPLYPTLAAVSQARCGQTRIFQETGYPVCQGSTAPLDIRIAKRNQDVLDDSPCHARASKLQCVRDLFTIATSPDGYGDRYSRQKESLLEKVYAIAHKNADELLSAHF